jgi:hypothetical protein
MKLISSAKHVGEDLFPAGNIGAESAPNFALPCSRKIR